jgi:hypothetical protein
VICDGRGVPLAVRLTGANRHHSQEAMPLVDAIPPRQGERGRPAVSSGLHSRRPCGMTLMAVPVGTGPSFDIPKPLFQTRASGGVSANRTHYVPSRDGQRFLVNMATDTVASPITVVLNWSALLNK